MKVIERGVCFYAAIGTGNYHFGSSAYLLGPETAAHHAENLTCEWSPAEPTNIPDAPSRTCASSLPKAAGGGVYMVHNPGPSANPYDHPGTSPQYPWGKWPYYRDPLLISTSRDGLVFDRCETSGEMTFTLAS